MRRFKRIYYDADLDKGANNGNGDTVIKYVYDGQVVTEADLSTPEGRKIAKELGEKGVLYNKKMHDIAAIEKKAQGFDQWNEAVIEAQNGHPEKLSFYLDQAGVKLTDEQQTDLDAGKLDLDDDGAISKLINKLNEKIGNLEKEVKNSRAEAYLNVESRAAHAELQQLHNGKDGLPKYDQSAIEKYCDETGLFMKDLRLQYATAYEQMNREAIMKARETELNNNKIKDKRNKNYVPSGDGGGVAPPPPKIDVGKMSYDEMVKHAVENAKEKGIPIELPDD